MRWPAEHPLQLALGLSAWSGWFVAVYGGHAVACEAVPSAALISGALLVFTALVGAALGWASWRSWAAARSAPEGAGRFVAGTGAVLHAVAALSTIFVGLPILMVPACA
jgi:hypothetical protein